MVNLNFLEDIINNEGTKLLEEAAQKLEKLARSEAPKVTGLLANSHTIERPNKKTRIVGVDGSVLQSRTGTDYSPFVYFGTRPHKIRVKNAQVLTDGESFFGREVNHPGNASNRWLERALGRLTL